MSRRTLAGIAGFAAVALLAAWAARSLDFISMLRRLHGM